MSDHLSTTFAALSDPTRRAILARLALGETSVKDLAEPFSISAPSITKHLKVLERANLITRSRDAQWRPCRLDATPLRDVSDWVENYRLFWEQNMNRLDHTTSPRWSRRRQGSMLAKGNLEVAVTLPSNTEIRFTCFFRRSRQILFELGPAQSTFAIAGLPRCKYLNLRDRSTNRGSVEDHAADVRRKRPFVSRRISRDRARRAAGLQRVLRHAPIWQPRMAHHGHV